MLKPLNLDLRASRYQGMIGVGGIGTGVFFRLNGDHTLGREESRSGHFLNQRDYCKLHIIAHYVKTLAGPDFKTIPVGRVGTDKEGQQLLGEMTAAGLDCQHVQVVEGGQTLFSFCFVYPDGSGGNLTTDDSVNASVDAALVNQAEPEFRALQGQGIALAAPEVSLAARLRLLEMGSQYGFLRVSSLTTEEMHSPESSQLLAQTDLFAGNMDEVAALAALGPGVDEPRILAEAVMKKLRAINPAVRGLITAGARGSWGWDEQMLYYEPPIAVQPVSTAGAGDAHLAGLIVGLVAGLSMADALKLGVLTAALSITSAHTIHPALDQTTLREFVLQQQVTVQDSIKTLLEQDNFDTRRECVEYFQH